MKTGRFRDMDGMNELQVQAACRENSFFENDVVPEVSPFDDHEAHIEEHLRYILQMKFRALKLRKPDYAAAMENHIKQHVMAIDN